MSIFAADYVIKNELYQPLINGFFVAALAKRDATNPKDAATTGFNHFVIIEGANISLFSKSSKGVVAP